MLTESAKYKITLKGLEKNGWSLRRGKKTFHKKVFCPSSNNNNYLLFEFFSEIFEDFVRYEDTAQIAQMNAVGNVQILER